MKPLLAHVYEPHRVTFPCFLQPKLNGIRALYQNGSFQSRDELPFPKGLLEHLSKPLLERYDDERIIFDGELYVHGWPLQRINAAVTPVRQQGTVDTAQVEYHIFDRVDYGLTFAERFMYPQDLFDVDENKELVPKVKQVETWKVHSKEAADERYFAWVNQGYEGMMYRVGNCQYTLPKQPRLTAQGKGFLSDRENRAWHLLKRKAWMDGEFECVGMQEGEGKYAGTLGAFICDSPPHPQKILGLGFRQSFTVGSGLTDAQRDYYWNNSPKGKKIKVQYLCLSSDGIPLNPTVLLVC